MASAPSPGLHAGRGGAAHPHHALPHARRGPACSTAAEVSTGAAATHTGARKVRAPPSPGQRGDHARPAHAVRALLQQHRSSVHDAAGGGVSTVGWAHGPTAWRAHIGPSARAAQPAGRSRVQGGVKLRASVASVARAVLTRIALLRCTGADANQLGRTPPGCTAPWAAFRLMRWLEESGTPTRAGMDGMRRMRQTHGGAASSELGGRTALVRRGASSCSRIGGLDALLLRRGPGCPPSGGPSVI